MIWLKLCNYNWNLPDQPNMLKFKFQNSRFNSWVPNILKICQRGNARVQVEIYEGNWKELCRRKLCKWTFYLNKIITLTLTLSWGCWYQPCKHPLERRDLVSWFFCRHWIYIFFEQIFCRNILFLLLAVQRSTGQCWCR